MATLRQELAADLGRAIPLYGQSFEWNGADYACVRRDIATSEELAEAGGWIERVEFWVTVGKSLFNGGAGPFPKFGQACENGTLRVGPVKGAEDPAAAQLMFPVGSFDQG